MDSSALNPLGLPLYHQGKVRDIYTIDDQHILIITTDRISAFDVILPTPIPGKGEVLTKIAQFWFDFFKSDIKNHLSSIKLSDIIDDKKLVQSLENNSLIVKKVKALPIEAIVRGYIIGSGWEDYQRTGQVSGVKLPENLQLADKLPVPIYTPSTKAAVGDHDENINFETTINILGEELAEKIKETSLKLYQKASEYALSKGIIIADTKFEFGLDENNELILIDEVLTPDSSRFWEASVDQPGISPMSFDKQYIRDYLNELVKHHKWNKQSPAPELPDTIIRNTQQRYLKAKELLIG